MSIFFAKLKFAVASLLWLGIILALSACDQDAQSVGATATAIVDASATSRAAITVIAAPTNTPTQAVALLPTNTPLPPVALENSPTPTIFGKNALTPRIATPTITPILPTAKRFTTTPGSGLPISTTNTTRVTPTQAGTGGDTQGLDTLKTSKVSFLTAYNRAVKTVVAVQPAAKIVLAQANYFTAARTGWTFYFVWPQGSKMYVVTFDSSQPNLSLNDSQPPILTQDAGQIQMEKVLDSPAIVAKVEAAGVSSATPIDSIYFERFGTPPQPAYICTNGLNQKQLIINAYTGQIIKNDFK